MHAVAGGGSCRQACIGPLKWTYTKRLRVATQKECTETKVVGETSAAAMSKMDAGIPNTLMRKWLENTPLMQVVSR